MAQCGWKKASGRSLQSGKLIRSRMRVQKGPCDQGKSPLLPEPQLLHLYNESVDKNRRNPRVVDGALQVDAPQKLNWGLRLFPPSSLKDVSSCFLT